MSVVRQVQVHDMRTHTSLFPIHGLSPKPQQKYGTMCFVGSSAVSIACSRLVPLNDSL